MGNHIVKHFAAKKRLFAFLPLLKCHYRITAARRRNKMFVFYRFPASGKYAR